MKVKPLAILAMKTALKAGSKALEVYSRDFKTEYKSDKSPVTEADILCNEIIVSLLNATQIPIISEENKEIDYSERKQWKYCWIVDPIDGTKEFVKRTGDFTINIALIEGNKPLLGVIYIPVTDELFFGIVSEKKSYKHINTSKINWESVFDSEHEISPSPIPQDTITVASSVSHVNSHTNKFINSLSEGYNKVKLISKGSSLKFCRVAEGKADIYPRFGPTMEWDTAAGQAICEAVGLQVIDFNTKKPLRYNRKNLLNDSFLVCK